MLRFPYQHRRGNAPGPKGVRSTGAKFIAQVHRGGRRFHLGTYPTEVAAAWAVNQALQILYPDLPTRFLNNISLNQTPSAAEQESIRQEVLLRLRS